MKQIILTEKEIKDIKRFVCEVANLQIVEGVYLLATITSNDQEHLELVALKNHTLDYYEKFPQIKSIRSNISERVAHETELLYSLIKKYHHLRNPRLSFSSDTTTNYNTTLINDSNISNVTALIRADILFDRFDYLNFLQEKLYALNCFDLDEDSVEVANLEDVLYEFSDNQTKENFYEIKSPFLTEFLEFVIEQYRTYSKKPNVLINDIDLLWDTVGLIKKVRAVRGYTITFSVDNIILRLSNVGLNTSMTLTQEGGMTKYYGGFNLVSIQHELPKNPYIQSVWYRDKGLQQYKINFELRNGKTFMVDIQCNRNYRLLNEPTNLIEKLKNSEITFNDINEVYDMLIKFINSNSCVIKIGDQEENYILYDHNILTESQQVIITDDEQITTKRYLEDDHYVETKTIEKIIPVNSSNKPYTRKRK